VYSERDRPEEGNLISRRSRICRGVLRLLTVARILCISRRAFSVCICAIPSEKVSFSNVSIKYADRKLSISSGMLPSGRFACLSSFRGFDLAIGMRNISPTTFLHVEIRSFRVGAPAARAKVSR
jgi:hypothetical protein